MDGVTFRLGQQETTMLLISLGRLCWNSDHCIESVLANLDIVEFNAIITNKHCYFLHKVFTIS